MASSREHYVHTQFSLTELLAAMDAVDVNAGIFVIPSIYGTDNRYALAVAAAAPSRLGVIGKIDERRPDVEDRLAAWSRQPGALGLRVIVPGKERQRLQSAEMNQLFTAASKHSVLICLYTPGCLADVVPVVERHPQLRLVIDHLGLAAPPAMPAIGDPFADLPALLALARRPNVAVKASGVPSLSTQEYPFSDVWPALSLVLDAFGFDRVMWGSDFTRVASMHSYREALDFILLSDRLSKMEKDKLLGATLQKVFRWSPRS